MKNLRAAAEKWMDENPEAMRLFRRFASQMLAAGKRFGIGQLTERVRWECALKTRGEPFKVNNNFRAYIARRLIRENPRYAGLIEVRYARC
jgi:hypothetical protein